MLIFTFTIVAESGKLSQSLRVSQNQSLLSFAHIIELINNNSDFYYYFFVSPISVCKISGLSGVNVPLVSEVCFGAHQHYVWTITIRIGL